MIVHLSCLKHLKSKFMNNILWNMIPSYHKRKDNKYKDACLI